MAVASGLATHVLCFRTVWESTAQGRAAARASAPAAVARRQASAPSGMLQWTLPFGAASAAIWIAMIAQRHFHEFGTTREQLAQIALNARRNAARNPKAIYREPMTPRRLPRGAHDLDALLPLRLRRAGRRRHGDRSSRASTRRATCAQAAAARRGGRHRAARAPVVGPVRRPHHDGAARRRPRCSGSAPTCGPRDVDVAELYDGFSFIAMAWLEALGFCGKGEGGPFVEGGARIALDGELPLNTHGGQLSAGRLHGYGFLHEACVQLWGEGGERQVPGEPQVAVAAAGGGPLGGCLLLVRE